MVIELNAASASKRNFMVEWHLTDVEVRLSTHFQLDLAATKLRSSSMSLHGVFPKSRVFDPTRLFEAKVKPMIQNKHIFVLFSDYCSEITYFPGTLMENSVESD